MRALLAAACMLMVLGPANALTRGQKIAQGLKTGEIPACSFMIRRDGMLLVVGDVNAWEVMLIHNVVGRKQERVSLRNARFFNDIVDIKLPYRAGGAKMCMPRKML